MYIYTARPYEGIVGMIKDKLTTYVEVMVPRQICDNPLYEPMMDQFTDAYMSHYASKGSHTEAET